MATDIERLATAVAARYAVEREIGHGAGAIVYLAEDLKYGRSVAIKVLNPWVATTLGSERFLQEVRITARLQHPHIVPLLDAGTADELLYFVMPYVEGQSLRARLEREGQLPIDDAVCIAQDVASALAYAHAHDVLHRDIKPENVLLFHDQAVVADFGVARAITIASGDNALSDTGVTVGTPAYMSPEQAAADRTLDGRSDIYALGCVLYEMIAGDPPFTGATAQAIIARHAVDPVPQLRTVRSTVSADLERVIVRAMAKVPADRFATAWEFGEALDACMAAGTARAASAPVAPPAETSIAVLPFLNLSADPQNEYFSDGLSEELMSALCRVGGLRVAARTSAFAFRGKDQDFRTIGSQLKVRVVLSGSVRRAGNRLRITAQLVNVADGYLAWSEQYDRELDDIFAIQADITAAIVDVLKLTLLTGAHASPVPRADVATYELYLRGRHFWNKRTEQGFDKGIGCFRQALARDAGYTPALAGLADCYTMLGIYGVRAPHEVMPLAKDAAAQALSLDPSLAAAHTSLGCVRAMFEFDWPGAERAFRRAIELTPSYPTAHHWYALNCLTPLGRFDEALAQMEAARELDPLSPVIMTSVGVQHFFARHYDRAIDAYRATLEVDDAFPMAYYFLGLACTELGRHDEAIAALKHAIALTGGTAEMNAALGYAYARAGKQRAAKRVLDDLRKVRAQRYVSPALAAQVSAGLGDTEGALASLEEAYATRAGDVAWLKVRPAFDSLRDSPRYGTLLNQMGLAPRGLA